MLMGLSQDFLGILFMCFLSPTRNDQKTHKQNFATTQFRDNPPSLFLQGGENGVLGKRWFCVSDTRHFRRFPGSEE